MKKRIFSLVILILFLIANTTVSFATQLSAISLTVAQSTEGIKGDGTVEPVYKDSAGNPYISFNKGDYQVFDFDISESGTYFITVYAGLSASGPAAALSFYDFGKGEYTEYAKKAIVPSGSYSEYGPTVMGEFYLTAGAHKVKLSETFSDIHLNRIEITKKDATPISLSVADNSDSFDSATGGKEEIKTNTSLSYSVFSTNDYYIFDVNIAQTGNYNFALSAAFRSGNAETEIYVYDEETLEYQPLLSGVLTPSGGVTRYATTDLGNVTLKSGAKKIKVLQKTLEIRLSSLTITYVEENEIQKKDVRESSASYNNATGAEESLAKNENGYYVSFNSGDWQDFVFYINKSGTYNVSVLAGLSGTAKTSLYSYNYKTGTYSKITEKNITPNGSLSSFGETEMIELDLKEGLNKLRLKQTSSDIHLHGIELRYLVEPEPILMTVRESTEGKTSTGEDETVYGSEIPYISFNSGDYQIFDFDIARSGRYEISLNAALSASGPITSISVYNEETGAYDELVKNRIEETGSFSTYGKTVMGEFNIAKGPVKLKISELYSDIHLSSISVEYLGAYKDEISVTPSEMNNITATEENGKLRFDTPQRADFVVNIPSSGNYEITAITTEAFYREPQISVWENNVELVSARIPNFVTNDLCVPLSLGCVNFTEGEHTLRVRHSGVTSSEFLLEKLIFTKKDTLKTVVLSGESYLTGDMAVDLENVLLSSDGKTEFLENGSLKFDAFIAESGYYLFSCDSSDNPDFVITSNEKVISNGKDFVLLKLSEGENIITVSTHENAVVDGMKFKYLPDVTDEILKEFTDAINSADKTENVKEIIEEYASYFDIDVSEIESGIFYEDAVYAGLVDREFVSAEKIISELYNLSKAEKTNPCVILEKGETKITALESGNLTLTVKSDKMRENLSVIFAIYNGGRLKGLYKGDYTGEGNEIIIPIGEIALDGTEKFKLISLDNFEDISPVNIRANIEAEIFVSKDGNDENDGITAPVKTIKRAQEIIAQYADGMTGDIIVNVAEGTYFEGETLVFSEAVSGQNGYNVIIRGEKGLTSLSGGKQLSEFTYWKDGIYKKTVENAEEIRNLYVNGYPATRAKSESAFWIEEVCASSGTALSFDGIVIDDEHFEKSFAKPSDLEVVLDTSWETQRFPVENVIYSGTKSTVLLDESVLSHNTAVEGTALGVNKMVYLENALELLDSPGEFFFDKADKCLYYYPLENENIETAEIVAGTLEGLVAVSGTSEESKAGNIVFENISFKYGVWNFVSDHGYVGTQSDVFTNTETGNSELISSQFDIKNAENVRISDCEFSCLGSNAVGIADGANNIKVEKSRFRDVAASGIYAGNFKHSASESTDVRTRNVVIDNNSFTRCGYEYRSCSAISLYYVNNVTISNNLIKDLPYSGITAGWGWGGADPEGWGNITIEGNKFDNVMQSLDDGGGVYLLGHMRNSKVTKNHFNKVGRVSSSMYADSGTGYAEFSENVSTNSRQWLTIASIGLHDVRVRNNFSDTEKGLITSDEYINEGNVTNIDVNNLPKAAQTIVNEAGLDADCIHLAEGNELPAERESTIFSAPKLPYYQGYKFEAEDCKSYTSGIVYANSYLGFNNLHSARFDVEVKNAGKYKVRAFIGTPGTSSKVAVIQNGATVLTKDVPSTGSYGVYRMLDIGEITLPEGISELTIKSAKNAFHLDCFILEPIE